MLRKNKITLAGANYRFECCSWQDMKNFLASEEFKNEFTKQKQKQESNNKE